MMYSRNNDITTHGQQPLQRMDQDVIPTSTPILNGSARQSSPLLSSSSSSLAASTPGTGDGEISS